ncbi:MAG: response regulator, partial [Deltaproteobacteria bacterium]|nr:response regulator [Deltaproteobacteria bacterium]
VMAQPVAASPLSNLILSSDRHPRVLIVDDNPANVELLKMQLKGLNYDLESAYDGIEGLEKVKNWSPDLILLDLMMPRMSGYEVCKTLKQDKNTRFIPIIIITALRELNDKLKAIEIGADDFLIKPYNKLELTTRIKSLLHMKELYDDLDSSENILFSLARALEAKDLYTRGHSERVALYALKMAKAVSLSERDQEFIRKGALLHDIGKIGIKEDILHKPGTLTAEERLHIQSHPQRGYDICKGLKSLQPSLAVIHCHHERFDGAGYPEKKKGEEIPLSGRIGAVVDSFDAMTTDRPYRKGMKFDEAIKILEKERNSGQWDPQLLDIFVKLIRNEA